MKIVKLLFIKLCSWSWKFSMWLWLMSIGLLVYWLGKLLRYLLIKYGYLITKLFVNIDYLQQIGTKTMAVGTTVICITLIVYLLIILITECCHIKIIRSARFSKYLHQLFSYNDEISDWSNEMRKALLKARNSSLVVVTKKQVMIVIKVPKSVKLRSILNDQLPDVANAFNQVTGYSSSNWQFVTSPLGLQTFEVMIFKQGSI
ncbi:hypothetical protein [Limosilactobacillus reuteri]|uniref:hypothetical protein n=2 Tax=Limosilactobacillus reuteri TaxID=1598 RepID=UPI0017850414|nr:hypothetical protein [Limosilactobacillus reuteri]